jgi:hypothetical protein
MHMLQSLFYLTTALRVSGVTVTHLQERETTVTTSSGNRYTVTDYSVTVTRCCSYSDFALLKMDDGDAGNKHGSCQIK